MREEIQQNSQRETSKRIQFSDVFLLEELPEQKPKTQRSSSLVHNAANIYRSKISSELRDSSMRYDQICYQTAYGKRKITDPKIKNISHFVKKLTSDMNQTQQKGLNQMTDNKFKKLKKIIEYYDIKHLEKQDYSNVIKSFGLRIQPMKTELKAQTISEGKPYLRQTLAQTAYSKIKRQSIKYKRKGQNYQHNCDVEENHKLQLIPLISEDLSTREIKLEIEGKDEMIYYLKAQNHENQKKRQNSFRIFNSVQLRKHKFNKDVNEKESKKKVNFSFNNNFADIIKEKVDKYRRFLFILNFSNRIYRNLQLKTYEITLKFYVGKGNNSNLIRSLMKKRFWFEETNNERIANFIWTQIKIPYIFTKQPIHHSEQLQKNKSTQRKSFRSITLLKNDSINRILSSEDYQQYTSIQQKLSLKKNVGFGDKAKLFSKQLKQSELTQEFDTIHNHLPGNGLLGNKKAMFYSLQQYYSLKNENVFDVVPRTFIINNGALDHAYEQFIQYFNLQKKKKKLNNLWIIKPGEYSNRGNGIECTNKIEDIRRRISQSQKASKTTNNKSKSSSSLILQEYICNPLLYNNRKFDLRVYMLLTYKNDKTKAYWYQDGYVRTSSYVFNVSEIKDSFIHLTNDAVQKNCEDYGRYEEGNKLSFTELQRYFDTLPSLGRNLDLNKVIIPQMKNMAANAVKSTCLYLNQQKRENNFQLFGLDFMIDQEFKPWLIEINTNPCLQLSSPILERIIPHLIENVLRISVDTMFPPPSDFTSNYKYNIPENSLHYNKFQLIFDSLQENKILTDLYRDCHLFQKVKDLHEEKEEYKQDGDLIEIQEM